MLRLIRPTTTAIRSNNRSFYTNRLNSIWEINPIRNNSQNFQRSYSQKNDSGNRFANIFDNKPTKKPKHNDSKTQGHKNNKYNKGHHNKRSHEKRPLERKVLRFELDKATPKTKSALVSIIEKVRSLSPSYQVRYIDPESSKLATKHLTEVVNNLDLGKSGIQLIKSPNDKELPLIKLIKLELMIKTHSDELAQETEARLIEQGSSAAMKALRQREKTERKKKAAKIVALSWNISLGDLKLQKKSEMIKKIEKQESFIIYIDGRKANYRRAQKQLEKKNDVKEEEVGGEEEEEVEEEEEETLMNEAVGDSVLNSYNNNRYQNIDTFELKRRQFILDAIVLILEETETKYTITGELNGMLTINCTPKVKSHNNNNNNNTKTSDVTELNKDIKRQRQIQKQKQREEELKNKKGSQDNLDSLYLFKIED